MPDDIDLQLEVDPLEEAARQRTCFDFPCKRCGRLLDYGRLLCDTCKKFPTKAECEAISKLHNVLADYQR